MNPAKKVLVCDRPKSPDQPWRMEFLSWEEFEKRGEKTEPTRLGDSMFDCQKCEAVVDVSHKNHDLNHTAEEGTLDCETRDSEKPYLDEKFEPLADINPKKHDLHDIAGALPCKTGDCAKPCHDEKGEPVVDVNPEYHDLNCTASAGELHYKTGDHGKPYLDGKFEPVADINPIKHDLHDIVSAGAMDCKTRESILLDDTSCRDRLAEGDSEEPGAENGHDSDESEIIFHSHEWFMEQPIHPSAPINKLIDHFKENYTCDQNIMEDVRKDIMPYMEATLEYLRSKYEIFENSTLHLVGSIPENSKVGKPDEFDFAVMLPVLSDTSLFPLFFDLEKMNENSKFLHILENLEWGSVDYVAQNIHCILNTIWAKAMRELRTDKLHVDFFSKCHLLMDGIAATFHLKRTTDDFPFGIDVSFWIPLSKGDLLESPRDLLPVDYLINHLLDADGYVYLMLLQDEVAGPILNLTRFATSFLEREWLLNLGPKGASECYWLAKCIAATFFPKLSNDLCVHCKKSMVSSYCLKQVVLYMMNKYKDDAMWTQEQMGNRILEVFQVLALCANTNGGFVASFFSPGSKQFGFQSDVFHKEDCTLKGEVGWVEYSEDGEELPPEILSIPCVLPDRDTICNLFQDGIEHQLLKKYCDYMESEEWKSVNILTSLDHVLQALLEEDESERAEFIEWPEMIDFSEFSTTISVNY